MWWNDDITQEMAIAGAVILAFGSLWLLGEESKDVVLTVAGGLIGYMSKRGNGDEQ